MVWCIVFEGKEKADRVALAVEKQVQHDDDGFATVKTGGIEEPTHVENVKEVGQKTA